MAITEGAKKSKNICGDNALKKQRRQQKRVAELLNICASAALPQNATARHSLENYISVSKERQCKG
jgi:hypothetical protein